MPNLLRHQQVSSNIEQLKFPDFHERHLELAQSNSEYALAMDSTEKLHRKNIW
jgi:hypothetical protein